MLNLSPSTAVSRRSDRAPPPSLFLGPPSRNTSAISLNNPPTSNTQPRDPLLRTRSARGLESKPSFIRSRAPATTQTQTSASQGQSEGDRTDALWLQMQATLAEVELSAFSSNHVFGQAHSAALEDLRNAQVQLARAWGRSEGNDNEIEDQSEKIENDENSGEEDNEQDDILVARKRREANERFFEKVQEGVTDVVAKLERVAAEMGKVERESRDIWSSGSDSLDTESVTS